MRMWAGCWATEPSSFWTTYSRRPPTSAAPPTQIAASETTCESNPRRRPSRCASQIATLAAATRISPYQRMGNPNRLNATGSISMTNGMVVPPRLNGTAVCPEAAGHPRGEGSTSRDDRGRQVEGKDSDHRDDRQRPEPADERRPEGCLEVTRLVTKLPARRRQPLLGKLNGAAISAHAAREAHRAGRPSRQINDRDAHRREPTIEPRVGEDDPLGACVVIVAAEDQPKRNPGPGDDRVRVVAAVDGDIDHLVTVGVEARTDGSLEHGQVCPPRTVTRTMIRTTSAPAAKGCATAPTIVDMPVIVIAPPANTRSATRRIAAARSRIRIRSGMTQS